ncbi:MAG: dienelactone hydrolase family protein [Chthoniobacterales bacterium]
MNGILEATPAFSVMRPEKNIPHRNADHMLVAGHNVRIDTYDPPPGAHPHTVLLLHGIGGLLGDGGLMRRGAKSLAAHGCHACVVHYFNATGTFFATHAQVREHVAEWRAAIVEAAHHYAQLDGEPVGILGYSLGGCLAVCAARETSDIGAVAVLCGGLPEEHSSESPAHLPPLLVLHGAKDSRVPLDRSDALVDMGRRAGALVESVVYPNEGHSFGASAERDALGHAAEFFATRLEAGAEP